MNATRAREATRHTIRNGAMRKISRETSHLRVRIESKLLARLENAREKNGETLTGEIVARLERSFAKEDKLQLLREARKTWISETDDPVEKLESSRQRWKAIANPAASVVDVLLGEEKLKSAFLRSVLLELAKTPVRELRDGSSRRQFADRVLASFENSPEGKS
jgi:hypothetical protein